MLFNSLEYVVFLCIVLALYYSLRHRGQNIMLLIASYVFYGFWDWRFLGLMLLSTIIDYSVGLALDRTQQPKLRKLFLIASICANLGILGFFKYFNFFIDNAERILHAAGLGFSAPTLYIILPVGISFYTFQTMSYAIDIYRGQLKPTRNMLDFALFVAYFPQLVAGPIERASHLLPALQRARVISAEGVTSGLMLILIGLFRKVVIADTVGPQVDAIFSNPSAQSSPMLLMGVMLFALQIYCDFAGYSDIARGTSRLLGIDIMVNFRQPYFAADISEFWRRWHISLSTWLRDYLYIPLGGNRYGEFNTYRNLMITMLLGGLWHGASWNFVIWGGLHGIYLSVHRLFRQLTGEKVGRGVAQPWGLGRILGIALTFVLVLLAWVFFRSPGLNASLAYLRQLFSLQNMAELPSVLPAILVPWSLALLVDIPQYITGRQAAMLAWRKPAFNVAVATMLFLIILGFGNRSPFIYFQF